MGQDNPIRLACCRHTPTAGPFLHMQIRSQATHSGEAKEREQVHTLQNNGQTWFQNGKISQAYEG